MDIKVGSSRVVFVFDEFVIKIPKFWRISRLGLGIVENLKERYWYCADRHISKMDINQYPLAPIHYASQNGLIVVMQRAQVVTEEFYNSLPPAEREQLDAKLKVLEDWAKGLELRHDLRWDNVGFIDDKLVAVDYGYSGRTMFYDCEPYFRHDWSSGTRKSIPTFWGKFWRFRQNVAERIKDMFDGGKELWGWIRYGGLWMALGARVLYNKVFHGKDD